MSSECQRAFSGLSLALKPRTGLGLCRGRETQSPESSESPHNDRLFYVCLCVCVCVLFVCLLYFSVADSFNSVQLSGHFCLALLPVLTLKASSVRSQLSVLKLSSNQAASFTSMSPPRPFGGRPGPSGRWPHLGQALMTSTYFAEECVVSLHTFFCLHVSSLTRRMQSTVPVAHITLCVLSPPPSCLNLPLPVSIDSQQPRSQS